MKWIVFSLILANGVSLYADDDLHGQALFKRLRDAGAIVSSDEKNNGVAIYLLAGHWHGGKAGARDLGQAEDISQLFCYMSGVSDSDVAAWDELRSVRKLWLIEPTITSESVKIVSTYSTLEVLSFHSSGITNDGLSQLGKLPKLRKLSLADTRIDDGGLSFLPELRVLEELSLDNTEITDHAIEEITKTNSLRRLSLRNTKISNRGIRELGKLKSLEVLHVDLRDSLNDGIEELRVALPNVKIQD